MRGFSVACVGDANAVFVSDWSYHSNCFLRKRLFGLIKDPIESAAKQRIFGLICSFLSRAQLAAGRETT